MENILREVNTVFAFCKKCWNYQKMTFKEELNKITKKLAPGQCTKCHSFWELNLEEIKKYYLELNEDNI